MSGSQRQKGRHRASPRPRIDATSTGRQPLSPNERRLVAALRVQLAKSGITHSAAGEKARIDPGDARRVLAFGPATPRTLTRLFETFHVDEYEGLSVAHRREALLLEILAASERQAELLGRLVALEKEDV